MNSSMVSNARYVLVTDDYPPQVGGVARYVGELVKRSNGVMRVIVPEGRETRGPGEVAARPFRGKGWPAWWPVFRICKSIDRTREMIVVTHLLPIGTAAWLARRSGGAPYVVICHGLDVRLAARNVWKRWLARRILRSAETVIANSRVTAEGIRKLFGISAAVVLPGGARTDFPDRRTARMRCGVAEGERVVLAVARLVQRKGFDRLIDAVNMLPPADDVRLVIIGDGPERNLLQARATGSVHRIEFLTDASDECVSEWYAAADVFCLPVAASAEDVEGFGIVFIEAASAGLPVVSTRTGGVPEAVLDGETGVLLDPGGDPRDLARALTRLLGDESLRRRLGEAGRARALRDFRWDDRWEAFEKAVSA